MSFMEAPGVPLVNRECLQDSPWFRGVGFLV